MCSCFCFAPYSWLKRQTHNSMLRYARSCCVADLTITLHVAWYDDCRWFLDLTSELCGVMLFEVCMLCFIVTFHVTTFDKGNRLVADKTHRFCAPHRQHKCILVSPLFLKFAIFGINFSFFVGIRARHDFRLLRNRSQINLPPLLPLTHTTCLTHRARG